MAHEIIVSIFWDNLYLIRSLLLTGGLVVKVSSFTQILYHSINIDVKIKELYRAWQDALQSALRFEYDLMFR